MRVTALKQRVRVPVVRRVLAIVGCLLRGSAAAFARAAAAAVGSGRYRIKDLRPGSTP